LKQLTQKESIDYYVGEMLFIQEKIKAFCEKSGLNNSDIDGLVKDTQ